MQRRTAVLSKNGEIALIGICSHPASCAELSRYDPRTSEIVTSHQDSFEMAEKNYYGSLIKSRARGWRVVYEGCPNFG